jgi:hypothetical protein
VLFTQVVPEVTRIGAVLQAEAEVRGMPTGLAGAAMMPVSSATQTAHGK